MRKQGPTGSLPWRQLLWQAAVPQSTHPEQLRNNTGHTRQPQPGVQVTSIPIYSPDSKGRTHVHVEPLTLWQSYKKLSLTSWQTTEMSGQQEHSCMPLNMITAIVFQNSRLVNTSKSCCVCGYIFNLILMTSLTRPIHSTLCVCRPKPQEWLL